MTQAQEILPRTWLVNLTRIEDFRGAFIKTVSQSLLKTLRVEFDLQEEYCSISKKNVIRGMHFQLPPYDHIKMVYCLTGAVLDVLLDLRLGPGYGKFYSIELNENSPKLLIIPKGIAHGFKSLEDNSVMVYKTSSEYAPEYDAGILWNSFGFDWGLSDPILSQRDHLHPHLDRFRSPFPNSSI